MLRNIDCSISDLRKSCRYPAKYMLSLLTDFVHNFIVIHLLKIAIFLDVDLIVGNTKKIPPELKQALLITKSRSTFLQLEIRNGRKISKKRLFNKLLVLSAGITRAIYPLHDRK